MEEERLTTTADVMSGAKKRSQPASGYNMKDSSNFGFCCPALSKNLNLSLNFALQ